MSGVEDGGESRDAGWRKDAGARKAQVEAEGMKILRFLLGVTRMDGIRNLCTRGTPHF